MNNPINILCTGQIESSFIEVAADNNIEIEVSPFIKTEPIETVEVQQEIESAFLLSTNVVFTSINAVEAVANYMFGEQPDWKIYCVGKATKESAEKYFGAIAITGVADNAMELAQLIIEEPEVEEIIFFCGNQRRKELPDLLRKNNIEINEIEVYETISLPHKLPQKYLGILFFSPSAVDSYFKMNKINDQTVLFSIGNTTAGALKKYTKNKIIVSDEPSKEILIEKMMEYFT